MPVSLEHLCIFLNGAEVPGGGPMEKTLKWTTSAGSHINKAPIQCELQFYDTYCGDAVAAD
jgi:hypothetical protein